MATITHSLSALFSGHGIQSIIAWIVVSLVVVMAVVGVASFYGVFPDISANSLLLDDPNLAP